jgi:LPXTG-motif cell wall-anchored protein
MIANADGSQPVASSSKGLDWVNALANGIASLGGAVKNIGDTFKKNPAADPNQSLTVPPKNSSNTGLWIGVGVVALVLGGVLFWYLKRKK